MIRDRLGAKPLSYYKYPIGIEASLRCCWSCKNESSSLGKWSLGAEWEYVDIPDDLKEISEKYRTELVEMAVEQDEKLMEAYLEWRRNEEEDLIKCIRKGTINFAFVPIVNRFSI